MESEEIEVQTKRELSKTQEFAKTNFEYLYDSFHHPLAEAIVDEGEIIGLNKEGEIKKFVHTEETRSIEMELSKYAKSKNIKALDLKILECFNTKRRTDTLNYIFFFYNVTLF